ncbi:mitochondrial GTPase 1 [Anabrus simplex]|uniref:mitochondrial GTPase 1 n=1 Tax=Anabrus simplex TaxID=316456 RepID=UPI0034DD39BE
MSQPFRECFNVVSKDVLHWFPGHMGRGLKQMQQKLKSVDCIIEVHDARIPFSGRNSDFKHTVSSVKPHILVLNKKDLIDHRLYPRIEQKLKEEGISRVLFTNCRDHKCSGVKRVVPLASDLISSSDRFNRSEQKEVCMMVIGVPNVGKSSLINALRNKYLKKSGVAHVGAVAGITRSVQNRIKIRQDPPVFLLDTPGILTPTIRDVEAGLRLAVCACLQDHLVGEDIIADYLLYILNKSGNFNYTKLMGLDEPTDDIGVVLTKGAVKLGKMKKIHNYDGQYIVKPDLVASAHHFLKAFRQGNLGRITLDEDWLNS